MISGGGHSRVFEVAAGTNVTLANLAITGGNGVADNPAGTSQDDGFGGGILNLGTLTVNNSILSGNSAGSPNFIFGGGGILNFGTLTVNDSTLSGNSYCCCCPIEDDCCRPGIRIFSSCRLFYRAANSSTGKILFGALAESP